MKKKHERISPDCFYKSQKKEEKLSICFMVFAAIIVLVFVIYLILEIW
jgi:hypothetical protein